MADQANHYDTDVYVRLKHINKGDPNRGIRPIFPVADSQIRKAIADGWFPAGIRISPRVTVYRLSEVMAALDEKAALSKAQARAKTATDYPDLRRD